jgi:predicted Zn-dependent peptidase
MENKFFKKILKNGMTVILEERKGSGVVSVAFSVRHGGIHESEEEKGISHFIEHMLYKGTKNRTAKKISEDIEKNGGVLNGFTEEELTAYWCKMPSKHLDLALDVLSDMILNPLFDEKELEKERMVIFEEMKMRRDMPNIYVLDKIQTLLYTGNLGFDLIGTEKSMGSIDKKKILEKFNSVYGSENLILCVVGEANFEKLCDFCEKKFKRSGFKIPEPKIGLKNAEIIHKKQEINQINMIFAYHLPNATQNLAFASQVLSCLMVGGMSSRLFQEIREKRNLAYAVKGGYNGGRRFGYGSVFVGTSPGNLEKIKKLIIDEFKKVKDIDAKEFEQVKEQLIGNSKINKEDSQGQMLDLLYNEIWKDAADSYKYEQNIKKVRIEDVKKLSEFDTYSFIALVPQESKLSKVKSATN